MHQECDSKEHIGALYERIHEIDKRVTLVEQSLEELAAIKTDVHAIKQILEQGRGMFKTAQFVVWIIGPILGFIYWVKNHVTL